jgi:hypothetical protein
VPTINSSIPATAPRTKAPDSDPATADTVRASATVTIWTVVTANRRGRSAAQAKAPPRRTVVSNPQPALSGTTPSHSSVGCTVTLRSMTPKPGNTAQLTAKSAPTSRPMPSDFSNSGYSHAIEAPGGQPQLAVVRSTVTSPSGVTVKCWVRWI